MMTKNAMQLKALIKKKAVEKNISAQLVMQNYMLERLLERIALSKDLHIRMNRYVRYSEKSVLWKLPMM